MPTRNLRCTTEAAKLAAAQAEPRRSRASEWRQQERPVPPGHAHDPTFQRAMAALQASNTKDAEQLLKALLRAQPRHVAALNVLGIVLTQQGQFAEAETYLRRAVRENARSDATLYNYGLVLKALRRPAEAIERFTAALAINPAVAETWNSRGTAFNDLGRYDDAIADFDRAIGINPHYADALCNKGKSLALLKRPHEAIGAFDAAIALRPDLAEAWSGRGEACWTLRRYDEALSACEKALALRPDLAAAWLGRGNVLATHGRCDEALAAYDKALALRPGLAEPWLGRGNVYNELKRYDEALAAYDAALATKPELVEAWYGRGNVLASTRQWDRAFAAYDKALVLQPDRAEAWLGRGNAFYARRQYDDALSAYEKAVGLKPELAEAWLGRGNICFERADHDQALAAYERALSSNPQFAEAWNARGNVLFECRQYSGALTAYDKAAALKPGLDYAAGTRLLAKLHMCDWANLDTEIESCLAAIRQGKLASTPFALLALPASAAEQRQCARHYVEDRLAATLPARCASHSHERIRLAYLSADFGEHPVAYLAAGLYEQHDRGRFEIIGVSFGRDRASPTRERLQRAFDRFVDVADRSEDEIAELIRELEIDIAIDLMGHTRNGRPGIFAQRPAPIQVSYLGYLGTMGADYIDYIMADAVALPSDQQSYYTEKIVHLPSCFLVNDDRLAIAPQTPTREQAGLPSEGFIFSSFNNSYKLAPAIFELWMRLLRAIDGSVLWLAEANPDMVVNLRDEAQRAGIDPVRIVFAPHVPLAEHMARQRLADLFLDTTPYNAGATAAAALWSGVPLLTLLGSTFVSRMAASMLHAVGLPELVAESLSHYEALALKVAADPAFSASLKQRLAHNRNTLPLFDTARFTRHIENAYVTMWQRSRRGLPPASFAVEPIERLKVPFTTRVRG
jgi:protein O-GlcNAc transferase